MIHQCPRNKLYQWEEKPFEEECLPGMTGLEVQSLFWKKCNSLPCRGNTIIRLKHRTCVKASWLICTEIDGFWWWAFYYLLCVSICCVSCAGTSCAIIYCIQKYVFKGHADCFEWAFWMSVFWFGLLRAVVPSFPSSWQPHLCQHGFVHIWCSICKKREIMLNCTFKAIPVNWSAGCAAEERIQKDPPPQNIHHAVWHLPLTNTISSQHQHNMCKWCLNGGIYSLNITSL